jgi:hypothetical protein
LSRLPSTPATAEEATARIGLLSAWRRGAIIAALSPAVLVATGMLQPASGLVSLAAAVAFAAVVHTVRRGFVDRCSLHRRHATISAVAQRRSQLSSPRRRRRIARRLRHTASMRPVTPTLSVVVWPRLPAVRSQLLALADELEAADQVDPAVLFRLELLLRDGALSPLLNERLPERELRILVRQARFNVTTCTATPDRRR